MHIKTIVIVLVLIVGLVLLGFLMYRNYGDRQEPEQTSDETKETSESIEIKEPNVPDIWERPTEPETKEHADLEMELETGRRNPTPEVVGGDVEYETKEDVTDHDH